MAYHDPGAVWITCRCVKKLTSFQLDELEGGGCMARSQKSVAARGCSATPHFDGVLQLSSLVLSQWKARRKSGFKYVRELAKGNHLGEKICTVVIPERHHSFKGTSIVAPRSSLLLLQTATFIVLSIFILFEPRRLIKNNKSGLTLYFFTLLEYGRGSFPRQWKLRAAL